MNAIILAAGKGSRMRKDGYSTPKPLLPILGVPNLERTVWMLHEFGIEDITVLCNSEFLEQYRFLQERYRCHILHNPIYRNTLYSMNQAIDLFHDTFVIEGDLVLARNIFSRQDNSFYYVMRYPQCGEDAWHPILEGEQITSFQIGYSNEPCLLGVSFWAQKDCPLVKSVLREYFTEENFKNDSIFWDDCITSVLRQIPIRVREVSSSDACEMNTGIEYKFAQEMCSKYFQNCLPFILDYGREQAIRSHRLNFVEDIDSCTQWQEQLLDYLGDKSQEGNLSRNPTVFTCGEFPFMAKDTQTGDYVAYFDVAEACFSSADLI